MISIVWNVSINSHRTVETWECFYLQTSSHSQRRPFTKSFFFFEFWIAAGGNSNQTLVFLDFFNFHNNKNNSSHTTHNHTNVQVHFTSRMKSNFQQTCVHWFWNEIDKFWWLVCYLLWCLSWNFWSFGYFVCPLCSLALYIWSQRIRGCFWNDKTVTPYKWAFPHE